LKERTTLYSTVEVKRNDYFKYLSTMHLQKVPGVTKYYT